MFNGITDEGKKYLAKCQATNKPVTFSSVKLGNGILDDLENPEQFTDLKSLKKEVNITNKEQIEDAVRLTLEFSNEGINEGFFLKEFGIFVQDNEQEILYWYINDAMEANWLPPASRAPVKYKYYLNIMATNLQSLVVNWSGSEFFITKEFLEQELAKKSDKGHKHNSNDITLVDNNKFVTDAQINSWNNKAEGTHKHNLLTIKNGSNVISYDGSEKKEITIESSGGTPGAHRHNPNDIDLNSNNRFVTDTQINSWNNKAERAHKHTPSDLNLDSSNKFVTDTQINSWNNKAERTHSHSILTIRNGGASIQYDGSSNQEIIIEAGTDTPGVHTHSTNDIVYLTGYNKHYSYKGALVTNDSLNKALAKLENALDDKASLSHSHSGYASIDHTHSGYAQTNHSHGSNNITYMTGYSKDNYGGAINTYDSLNTAIGKLEKNLENKAGVSHSHSQYLTSGDISGYLTNKADKNHSHSTNDVTSLAGYSKGYSGAIRASDSLNEALSKLEMGVEEAKNSSGATVSWDKITGKPSGFTPNAHYQPSNTITSMEGYYKGYSAGAINTSDSLNTAISKLEVGLGNKASVDHSHSGYALASHSHSGYASSSHNHDSSYLKLSGGTISGNLQVTGTINGSKVYNGVWNDYAELFEKGEETEAGDIVCLDISSDKEQYIKADENSKMIIGVHSDTFAHLIGGEQLENFEDNFKKFIPIGLAGRVNVKVKGKVSKGDYIVPSDEKGIGRAYNKETDDRDMIIGFLVESDDKVGIRRLKMYINKK